MDKDENPHLDHDIPSSTVDLDKGVPMSELPSDHPTVVTKAAEMEYEYISGIKLWLAIAAVTLVCFLMMLDMSIIVTAIPRITSTFHSLPDVGWYGSVYLLANSAFQPLTGKLYSSFGSKPTFLAFLGLFELGSLLCGVAQSSKMLIIGRAVAGLGASGLTNGSLTIIAAAAPMHKRPGMIGIMMAISQLGVVGGPLIGGALTQYVTWRWCFYINLPIGALAAVALLVIKIPDRRKHLETKKATLISIMSNLDLIGFFLFAPFAIMFLMALEWGGTNYPWDSAIIIGLFCGSGGAFVIFAVWEYRIGDKAMFPYSILQRRVVWSSCLVMGFFFGGLFIYSYYLPIYFQAVKGISPALAGVYVLPGILSQISVAAISGFLVGKLGYYLPWSVASGIMLAIGSGLISTFKPNTPTARWVGYQMLSGIGRGCAMSIPVVAIQNILPPQQIPVGMSIVAFCQTFGGTLFLTFAEAIFSRGLLDGLKEFAPTVDPIAVTAAGALGIRQVVKPDEVLGVLEAYSLAIDRNFYLAAGCAVATFAFSWGMGWYSVKKK